MKLIYAAILILILLITGCSKEPEPPEVSPMSSWLPSAMNEYDLAPEYTLKKLPML